MNLRDAVRTDMRVRLTRTRLDSMLRWTLVDPDPLDPTQPLDPDDLSPILDSVFRLVSDLSSQDDTTDHVSDMDRLYAAGQVCLWRAVKEGLVLVYDVTADGETYRRSQILQSVESLLSAAKADAAGYGVDLAEMPPATISRVTYDSPYDADRPLIYAGRIYDEYSA